MEKNNNLTQLKRSKLCGHITAEIKHCDFLCNSCFCSHDVKHALHTCWHRELHV